MGAAMKNVPEAPLEVGDLLEIVEGTTYQVGEMRTNEEGTRVHIRLDRKFEPSIELIVRKRRYFRNSVGPTKVVDAAHRIWKKWRFVKVKDRSLEELIEESVQAGWDAAIASIAEG